MRRRACRNVHREGRVQYSSPVRAGWTRCKRFGSIIKFTGSPHAHDATDHTGDSADLDDGVWSVEAAAPIKAYVDRWNARPTVKRVAQFDADLLKAKGNPKSTGSSHG